MKRITTKDMEILKMLLNGEIKRSELVKGMNHHTLDSSLTRLKDNLLIETEYEKAIGRPVTVRLTTEGRKMARILEGIE